MAIMSTSIKLLNELIGQEEAKSVVRLAQRVDRLEAYWKNAFIGHIDAQSRYLLDHAFKTGQLDLEGIDFRGLVMRHSLSIMEEAIRSIREPVAIAEQNLNIINLASSPPPDGRLPTSLQELRRLWDDYRVRKNMPKRQRNIADRIKKAYIKKLQEIWVEYGEGFRIGDTATRNKVVNEIIEQSGVAKWRAKMIVETETTYYYNKTRVEIYDQSEGITHYIYVAIRDHRTTDWCRSRQGIVYKKGTKLFEMNRPPNHWNCRSEVLPLSPDNPRHLALINDLSRQAENVRVVPLPKGWT
jgi:SPP1 gp7 family putative phage head morphogenesis protein